MRAGEVVRQSGVVAELREAIEAVCLDKDGREREVSANLFGRVLDRLRDRVADGLCLERVGARDNRGNAYQVTRRAVAGGPAALGWSPEIDLGA